MMALDPILAQLLACPVDRGPLLIVGDKTLYNPRLRVAYPVIEGIPVLLAAEGRAVSAAEHETFIDDGAFISDRTGGNQAREIPGHWL